MDTGKLCEVVRKAVVVLYPSIDAIVENDDLICIEMYPSEFRGGFPRCRTETLGMEFLDEFVTGGRHDDFRAG